MFAKTTTVFVGYSFSDGNVREVTAALIEAMSKYKRRSYIIFPRATEMQKSRFERFNLGYFDGTLQDLVNALQTTTVASVSAEFFEQNVGGYYGAIVKDIGQLENIFTMLRLGRVQPIAGITGIRQLQGLEGLVRAKRSASAEAFTIQTLFQQQGRWLVTGAPGSGKSTLLRMAFLLTALQGANRSSTAFPIFVDMGKYRLGSIRSRQLILESIGTYFREPITLELVEQLLATKRVVWFMDSLDEAMIAGTDKLRPWMEVERLALQYPQHSFTVSCRLSHVPDTDRFENIYIEPFNDLGVHEFIQRYLAYFGSDADPAAIMSSIPAPARAIARTPLVLSMMVSAYLSLGSIPESINELYHLLISHVLEDVKSNRPGTLFASTKDQLLAHLAFEMLVSGRPTLRVSNVLEIVGAKIEQLYKQHQIGNNISADVCLEALVYSGLVVRRNQYLSFLHLTIMEYFASCEMNREYNFVAQSTMDQHFLRNPEKIKQIIQAANIQASDIVLELGAGIGSVARHLPTVRQLLLLDLDRELARILRFQFPNATIIQADAVQTLSKLEFDVLFSNLPFFLSDDIIDKLCDIKFRVALMSVKLDFDREPYRERLNIEELLIIDEEDFFPRQPFKSRIIRLKPSTSV